MIRCLKVTSILSLFVLLIWTTLVAASRPALPETTYPPAGNLTAPRILVYVDDSVHIPPNSYPEQALQALGYSYTFHTGNDFATFEASLTGEFWDLVIFANEAFSPPVTTWDALDAYVQGGGRLLLHSWVVSGMPAHNLWATLGFTHIEDLISDEDAMIPPDPVYWWSPEHPILSTPYPVPEFTNLTNNCTGCVYGQLVEPLPGFEALAGYTTTVTTAAAALIVGNEGRTVFRGFLDVQNDADENGNEVPDGVELWQNLITFMQPPVRYVTVNRDNDSVHLLDANLNNISSFNTGSTSPNGVATDGTLIYSGHFITEEVVVYNFTGVEQFRWTSPSLTGMSGMAVVEGALAVTNFSEVDNGTIDFLNPATGAFIRSIPFDESNAVEGLVFDGQLLWQLGETLVGVDPDDGAVVSTLANAAISCSFEGTGLAALPGGRLALGCDDGRWFIVSTEDGAVLESGNNQLPMYGLKYIPIETYLPVLRR